jgi:hypothetical protein
MTGGKSKRARLGQAARIEHQYVAGVTLWPTGFRTLHPGEESLLVVVGVAAHVMELELYDAQTIPA